MAIGDGWAVSRPGKFGQASRLRRDFQRDGDGGCAGQAGPPRRHGVAVDLSVVRAPFRYDGEPIDAEVNDADICKGFCAGCEAWTATCPKIDSSRQGVFLQSSQKNRIHSCPRKKKERQDTLKSSAFTCRHLQNYSPPVKMPIISNIFDGGENSNL